MNEVHRNFMYVGDDIPKINEEKYGTFLMIFQKALLVSLRERRLLNDSQYEQCVQKLEEQYKKN